MFAPDLLAGKSAIVTGATLTVDDGHTLSWL
jgi:hypothetical protein